MATGIPCAALRAGSTFAFLLTALALLAGECCATLNEWPFELLTEVSTQNDGPQRVVGYHRLNNTHAANMFYWFFESRTQEPDDPVVLWIHGGPGCSSALAVFYHSGPFRLESDGSLRLADYSWDVNHNVIYVDQPMNTGFSYSTDPRDRVLDEERLAADMVVFLQEFFDAHPTMQGRDFILAGVSFAGHMVPNIATALHAAGPGQLPFRFAGVALGNPWINPAVQYTTFGSYAYDRGLIDVALRELIDNQGVPLCHSIIETCIVLQSPEYCSRGVSLCGKGTVGAVTAVNPGINVYDVRKQCVGALCYDYSRLADWINLPEVREALGTTEKRWDGPCSSTVHSALLSDWLLPYDHLLVPLLHDGIRVLIYAGREDLLCSWAGQEAWLEQLPWSGLDEFAGSAEEDFLVAGRVAGVIREAGPLAFIVVDDAGHDVPLDVPEVAWHLYSRFSRNLTLSDDADVEAYLDAVSLSLLTPSQHLYGGGVATANASLLAASPRAADRDAVSISSWG